MTLWFPSRLTTISRRSAGPLVARRRLRLVRSIFVLEIERITEACWAP